MDDILECGFNSFKLVLFILKWYMLRLNQNDHDRNIIEHDKRFMMINTRSFELVGDGPYFLPSQCEKVFYFGIPHKLSWSFFVRHDPRGRPVKYNVTEEEDEGGADDDEGEDE